MIKPLLHFLLLFLLPLSLCGQINLVPNPSFEDTVACPVTGWINNATQWYNPTNYSPDYYNECVPYSQSNCFSVPNNSYGNQPAKSGNAYAGIVTAFMGSSNSLREYIQTQLIDTLTGGKKYYLRYYVCLSDSSPYAVNNIGAYFSNNSIGSTDNFVLPYTPQVDNNAFLNPLAIRNVWIAVQDSFIAQGGERYLTIGNFHNDLNTDTTTDNVNTSQQYGYYFIDDITLDTSNNFSTSIQPQQIELGNILIFPNPAGGSIFIHMDKIVNGDYELIDAYGNSILKQSFIMLDNTDIQINCEDLNNGIYILRILTIDKSLSQKIIINH